MINKNVVNIAKFDFINTLKSKGFVILNAVLCVLIVVALNITSIINAFKSSGVFNNNDYIIEIYDANGNVYNKLLQDYDKHDIKEIIKKDTIINYDYESIGKKIIAINVMSTNEYLYDNVEIITKDTVSDSLNNYIIDTVTEVRNKSIEDKYGISDIDKELYKEQVIIKQSILSEAKNQNDLTLLITTIVGYIIFMLVMTITTTVASNVANEKTSKSAEYIFSAISAKDYLNGKILAANLKTVTTLVLVVFYALLGLAINSAFFPQIIIDETITIPNNSIEIGKQFANPIIYVIIVISMIFITNTLLSYIQAYLASKIKSVNELDSAIMLPTVILVLAYFVSNFVFETTNIAIYVASCVPLFSMFVLPTAFMLNKVNIFMVLLSLVILIVTLIIVYKFVVNNFKNNILDLGKRKEEKEVDLKLKAKEQEIIKLQKSKLAKYILCVAFALILALVLGNILGLIPYLFQDSNISIIMNIVIFAVYIGVPAFILSKMLNEKGDVNNSKEVTDDHKKQKTLMYYVGLAGLLLAQIINVIIVNLFNIPQSSAMDQLLQVPENPLGMFLFIIYLSVTPAIFEELLFRKAMLNGAKRFGARFAIIFTAVMFGLFHQNLQQIFGTMLIGLVLAYITIKTGDIKTAIAVHFTNNLFATLAQIVTSTKNTALMSICSVMFLIIFILMLTGVFIVIKTLIKNRRIFKLEQEKNCYKVKFSSIISNYYMIILIMMIISTVILNLRI